MAKAPNTSQMAALSPTACGRMINPIANVKTYQTARYTLASSMKTKHMAKASITALTALNTKARSLMAISMAMAKSTTQTASLRTKATGRMTRDKAKAKRNTQTVQVTKAATRMTRDMAMASIPTQTTVDTKASGRMARNMAKAPIST